MNVGFIGFGEASYALASGLKEEGIGSLVAYDPLWDDADAGKVIKNRMDKAGAKMAKSPEQVFKAIDMLIVAVPADKAYEVARSLVNHLTEGLLYIDVSASTPKIKEDIERLVEKNKAKFVDAAMMGPLPIYKHKVPILGSGSGTEEFIEQMTLFNMNITKLGEQGGAASAVKLIRSIFMKGLAALLIEMLEAAHYYKVEDIVINSICETIDDNGLKVMINRLITGTAIHSERRTIELSGTLEMLEAINMDAMMTKETLEKLKSITDMNLKEIFHGETPSYWLEVIEAITEQRKSNSVFS